MKIVCTLLLASAALFGQRPAPDDALKAALKNRVDEARKGTGMVLGQLTSEGRTFIAYGRVSANGAEPDANTMFEAGSLTKVFTALLLSDMVERGEVAFDDPVSKYLPASVKVPSRDGRAITLADLTTHTSGLPQIPTNMDANSPDNPYAKYGATELYAFLSSYTLPRTPGETWGYSNLGVGLLGHVLSLRARMSYEQLIRKRILEPLGLKDTTITLSAAQRLRMAMPYDENLQPVALWDFDALAGCGALRSTASDMLTFAEAAMGSDTPLKAAFQRMLTLRRPGASPQVQQAAGWIILKPFESEIRMHDGGTHGFRSSLMIDAAHHRAAIVWINGVQDVNDIAAHAVEPRSPLSMLPAARPEITLDAKQIDAYAGVYTIAPGVTITITRDDHRMFAQLTGQGPLEIFAEKPDAFFLKIVDAQLTFQRDAAGVITGLVLHQNGRDTPASRGMGTE